MNKLFSQGKTLYVSIGKDTTIKDIVGFQDMFSSRRFRKINENESSYLFEIIPEIKLNIKSI